jgi:hypothetical protein
VSPVAPIFLDIHSCFNLSGTFISGYTFFFVIQAFKAVRIRVYSVVTDLMPKVLLLRLIKAAWAPVKVCLLP